MTRKDYVLLAGVIASCREDGAEEDGREAEMTGERNRAVYHLAHKLADQLARDNARFDRSRFLEAAKCAPYKN